MKRNKLFLAGLLMWTILMVTLCSTIQAVTLARYSAQGSGGGEMNVAKWNVTGSETSNGLKNKIYIMRRVGTTYNYNPGQSAVYAINTTGTEVAVNYAAHMYIGRTGGDAWDVVDASSVKMLSGTPPAASARIGMITPWIDTPAITVTHTPLINGNYRWDEGNTAQPSTHWAYYERIYYYVDAWQAD